MLCKEQPLHFGVAIEMRILLSLLLLSLSSCVPLPQMQQYPSRVPFHAVYDLGDRSVLFSIGGDEGRPKDYTIIPEHSYVVDPSGTCHPIQIKPHDFDVSQHYPFIRDEIFILRSGTVTKPIRLYDGTWKFVLVYRRLGGLHDDTFSFRIWTFFYSPIIHGPPN